MRPYLLTTCVAVSFAVAATGAPAHATLTVPGHPGAPSSQCQAQFTGDSTVTCTITALGRHFAAGAHGAGAFRVVLEPAGGTLLDEVAGCTVSPVRGGCVGAATYDAAPFAAGTQLVCRVYGTGAGTFECGSFDIG